MEFRSSDYSALAASLATVAIAALVNGPVAAGGAALTSVVAIARARFDANGAIRDVRVQVTKSVAAWAAAEGFDSKIMRLGLTAAAAAIEEHGLASDKIADLGFDPSRITDVVIRTAKAYDPYWGTEDFYTVAERAVRETYGALISQYVGQEPVLLPTLTSLREHIDIRLDMLLTRLGEWPAAGDERAISLLGRLVDGLVRSATSSEVMTYLLLRINDWDAVDWLPGRPAQSVLERRLRVSRTEPKPVANELSADEALAGTRVLVVLGDPGSGKTWLARRYARLAAQRAMEALEEGAAVEDVEIPLFVTWAQWARASGSGREGLVEASFASGLGHTDLGGSDIDARLKRTLTRSGSRVLVVVDSLDEAADRLNQATRLRELTSIPGWRTVVTSRWAAWKETQPGADGNQLVVELLDLEYPGDVRAFLRSWFRTSPSRGEALWMQIERRPELRRLAVVPLLLTFLCVLAEDAVAAEEELPARRQELYRRLVRRLLQGKWTPNAPGLDTSIDAERCEELLKDWAWKAIEDGRSRTGFRNWGDVFVPTSAPPDDIARAIDNVAPKVDMTGDTLARRFLHRTIMEHFVSEHIATFDARTAVGILSPHIHPGADADWKAVAPIAIAYHHREQPGVLMDALVTAVKVEWKFGGIVDHDYFANVLLRIALEASAGAWPPDDLRLAEQRRWILDTLLESLEDGKSDVHLAAVLPALSVTSEERTALIRAARGRLFVDHFWGADPRRLRLLRALAETTRERENTRQAVLNVLPTLAMRRFGYDADMSDLMLRLIALEPTEQELDQVLQAIQDQSLTWGLARCAESALARVIPRLVAVREGGEAAEPARANQPVRRTLEAATTTEMTEAERRAAGVNAILSGLHGPALTPAQVENAEAGKHLLIMLQHVKPGEVGRVVRALLTLEPTQAERVETRRLLLTILQGTELSRVGHVVDALLLLAPTRTERETARRTVLASLTKATPPYSAPLADSLQLLGVTQQELSGARDRVLSRLSEAEPRDVRNLVDMLCALKPTSDERRQAREYVLNSLHEALCTRSNTVGTVASALPALASTRNEKRKSRQAILRNLISSMRTSAAELDIRSPTIPSRGIRDVVGVVLLLEPSKEERSEARQVVLAGLDDAARLRGHGATWDIARLMPTLHALGLTRMDREWCRRIMLTALSHAGPSHSPRSFCSDYYQVVHELLDLSPTQQDLRTVREQMPKEWPDFDRVNAERWVAIFLMLAPTLDEQAVARKQLLRQVMSRDKWQRRRFMEQMVASLLLLESTSDERAALRPHVLTELVDAKPEVFPFVFDQFTALIETERERRDARELVARELVLCNLRNNLPDYDDRIEKLVGVLLALEPEEEEREDAREQVLTALPNAMEKDVASLVRALSALVRTEVEHHKTAQQLQVFLGNTRGEKKGNVTAALKRWESMTPWATPPVPVKALPLSLDPPARIGRG